MVTEQDKTLKALQIAIRMENDGKQYYQKLSHSSDNKLGRELFHSLAAEENVHRQKFEEIYDAIRSKKAWLKVDFQPDWGRGLRNIFAKALNEIDQNVKAPATELEAIQTAVNMESKSYDFYKSQGKNATHNAERDFYETLAAEEREHHLVLLDYYEYLKDPAAWFVSKERPSLDGG